MFHLNFLSLLLEWEQKKSSELYELHLITEAGGTSEDKFDKSPVYVNNLSHPKSTYQWHFDGQILHDSCKRKTKLTNGSNILARAILLEPGPSHEIPGQFNRLEVLELHGASGQPHT